MTDAALASCLYDPVSTGPGFCYLDAEQDLNADGRAECADGVPEDCIGSPAVLEGLGCEEGSRRALRLSGVVPQATLYLSGVGQPCL